MPRFCGACLKDEADARILLCGSCGVEAYCSKECQRRDWPSHKLVCNRRSAALVPRGNLTKAAADALAAAPETAVHPYREGKLARMRPCPCFDAPRLQYWSRAGAGICFNYTGQCSKTLDAPGVIISQVQFNCARGKGVHTVRRRYCSEQCERENDATLAHKNIIELDEYRRVVADKLRELQGKATLLQLDAGNTA